MSVESRTINYRQHCFIRQNIAALFLSFIISYNNIYLHTIILYDQGRYHESCIMFKMNYLVSTIYYFKSCCFNMRLPSAFDRHSQLRPTKSVSSPRLSGTRFLIPPPLAESFGMTFSFWGGWEGAGSARSFLSPCQSPVIPSPALRDEESLSPFIVFSIIIFIYNVIQ